jgi:hypothetical protein
MWNMKHFVILVVIGAMGIVSKGLKNLKTIPGHYLVYSLQERAVLGTLHMTRKMLQSET